MRLSKIRKLTGDHMVMSKSVAPHAFSVVEVDFANVDKARATVKNEWKATEGFSLTYLPFIARAVIDASSGLFCVAAGHCRREIAEAVGRPKSTVSGWIAKASSVGADRSALTAVR